MTTQEALLKIQALKDQTELYQGRVNELESTLSAARESYEERGALIQQLNHELAVCRSLLTQATLRIALGETDFTLIH